MMKKLPLLLLVVLLLSTAVFAQGAGKYSLTMNGAVKHRVVFAPLAADNVTKGMLDARPVCVPTDTAVVSVTVDNWGDTYFIAGAKAGTTAVTCTAKSYGTDVAEVVDVTVIPADKAVTLGITFGQPQPK
jgi:hypothetical protein